MRHGGSHEKRYPPFLPSDRQAYHHLRPREEPGYRAAFTPCSASKSHAVHGALFAVINNAYKVRRVQFTHALSVQLSLPYVPVSG
jgi:hypothetical protein